MYLLTALRLCCHSRYNFVGAQLACRAPGERHGTWFQRRVPCSTRPGRQQVETVAAVLLGYGDADKPTSPIFVQASRATTLPSTSQHRPRARAREASRPGLGCCAGRVEIDGDAIVAHQGDSVEPRFLLPASDARAGHQLA